MDVRRQRLPDRHFRQADRGEAPDREVQGRLHQVLRRDPGCKFVRQGFAVAKLKPGVIGVKVEIMDPEHELPDEIDVLTPEEAMEALPEHGGQLMVKKEELAHPIVRLGANETSMRKPPR